MKKTLIAIAALMMTVSLTACNTFAGAGKDVERGGEKMQNAAEKKQAQ